MSKAIACIYYVAMFIVAQNSYASTSTASTTQLCATPKIAAEALITSWTANDKRSAKACANASTIKHLFATQASSQNRWRSEGCDLIRINKAKCVFSYEGGASTLLLDGSKTKGWKVTGLTSFAD